MLQTTFSLFSPLALATSPGRVLVRDRPLDLPGLQEEGAV